MHKVEITGNSQYGDFKQGETGEIVGFCRGADDCPYVVVNVDNRYVMVHLHAIKRIL
jgi:hypothetical protein